LAALVRSGDGRGWPLLRVLRLAVWAALLAGVGELAARLLARAVLPEPIFINPASVWLGPVSALLLFTPVMLLAWMAGRLRGPEVAWGAAVAAAVFLAVFDVLMLVPRLQLGALAVLAAGIAAVAGRASRRWPARFEATMRWSTASLGLVCVAGGIVGALAERSDRDGRDGPAAKGPNVLLLILDTVRAMELSGYGYQRPTSPRLDVLTREGVQFERAVANAPWTLPTHAALFTGRFQRDLSVGWATALDETVPTLAEQFAARGYATGGFIANLRYCSREYGLARGFATYRDYALTGSQVVGSTMLGRQAIETFNDWFGGYVLPGRKDAERVVNEFLAWRADEHDAPYFAFLNFFDAHDPYAPEAPYDLQFAGTEPPSRLIEFGRRHSAEEIQGLRDAYDGAISSLDAQLGRLFDALRQDGTLDRTIVVVTADHGEEFAEHGHLGHGSGLHFPALHVPLLVRWPQGGVPAGVRVREPVSLVDVPATILDLAGDGPGPGLPGASLAPLWRDEEAPGRSPILSELFWAPGQPDWYPIAGGDIRSLVLGSYHYIVGPGDQEQLFDIISDPFERQDVMAVPALADTVAAMRRILARFPVQDRGGR